MRRWQSGGGERPNGRGGKKVSDIDILVISAAVVRMVQVYASVEAIFTMVDLLAADEEERKLNLEQHVSRSLIPMPRSRKKRSFREMVLRRSLRKLWKERRYSYIEHS